MQRLNAGRWTAVANPRWLRSKSRPPNDRRLEATEAAAHMPAPGRGLKRSRQLMQLSFEQIDEAAGESGLGIVACLDGNEIAHRACEHEAFDLPDAKRGASPIANLNQDNLIAAAAFAR